MPNENINVPPIVRELAGDDPQRLGVAAHAYYFLWEISCGRNGDFKSGLEAWVTKPQHSWLETPSEIDELTPLAKLCRAIEAEKQRMLSKGLDPCPDFNLN